MNASCKEKVKKIEEIFLFLFIAELKGSYICGYYIIYITSNSNLLKNKELNKLMLSKANSLVLRL